VDTVALAATIGGSLVGLAGVGATAWSSWLQRKSATELAVRQQEHERQLARGAHLFERRAAAYEEMLRLAYVWEERVSTAEAAIRAEPPNLAAADLPDLPTPEEMLALLARFGTVSSEAVQVAFQGFLLRVALFRGEARRAQNVMAHGGGDAEKELAASQETARKLHTSRHELQRLVSDELTGL
jgi:hypothetical protein